MNVILSNPIISKFLSDYPAEKHTNCLLGIILFGIYNLQALSIDFSKILLQVESNQPKPASSFLARVQNSVQDDPRDTPRFTSEPNPEKRSLSFSKISTGNKRIPHKPVIIQGSRHMKTPSIVNPEILNEYSSVEYSEVLRIADQFLNGQFVNEYCKSEKKFASSKENEKWLKERREEGNKDGAGENSLGESKKARSNSSLSLSGRRNSYGHVPGNRSIHGDRSTSYSKFW